MNRKTWLWSAGTGLALLAVLGWAFAPRPVDVEVATATTGPFETTINEDARTRLRDRYVVSAPLAGRLQRPTLREGDAVAEGQVVATLTPLLSPLLDERTVREQQARVRSAEAAAERARSRIGAAKVALELAQVQLRRTEQRFLDWDCSTSGFEGVRAQDILPLCVERFGFDLFIGFANVIDPFIDRGFGPNFDADAPWDRAFIDRVHARDEAEIRAGRVKPTHMFAVMTRGPGAGVHHDGLSPADAIRRPG